MSCFLLVFFLQNMVSKDPKQHGQIKLGAMQFAAGGAAGIFYSNTI